MSAKYYPPKCFVLLLLCLALCPMVAASLTVNDFGATGDGETDDTAALQKAADAGLPLVFDSGTYRITATIVISLERKGYMGVTGAAGATRIVMEGAGPALRVVGTHDGTANPAFVKPGVWERERFPVISDLEVLGAHEEAEGIRLEGTMQCTVTRVLIRNCMHGIRLVKRNRNVIISDCHLYENHSTGIFLDAVNLHQTNIIGNHISYGGDAGILVRNGEVRNIQITGNDIEYNYQNGAPDAVDVLFDTREGTLREFTITGNTIQAVPSENGANVRILGEPVEVADRSGLGTISGNLIASQTVNIDLQNTRGVTITGNSIYSGAELSVRARRCKNITVSGNNVDYNPTVEDRVKDGFLFESCHGVSVTGNTLADCRAGDPELGGAIAVRNCRDVVIAGCVIIDPMHRGIDVRNSASCRIAGNIISDSREPRRMVDAITVGKDSTAIVVTDNLLSPEE
ncbi:MAG TPA: hypothetical protein ENN29_02555 [Candidatus Hydrogenedentes bacterium]|nr:hypothetical protein [Candidatus Hydrogenedentota bacterium]